MFEEYKGKTLEGVYACYAVTEKAHQILGEFSKRIAEEMNAIPDEKKPAMKTPSHHLTLEYKGQVKDILSYVDDIKERKNPGSIMAIDSFDRRKSNIDGTIIPHLTIQANTKLPFVFHKEINPHVSLLEIENDENKRFLMRFMMSLPLIKWYRAGICQTLSNEWKIEIDTSKIQIRGKVDGEKQLIVEV